MAGSPAQRAMAEMVGTFLFSFLGAAAFVADERSGGALGIGGVAAVHGLALAAIVAARGPVSGAPVNPAGSVVWALAGGPDAVAARGDVRAGAAFGRRRRGAGGGGRFRERRLAARPTGRGSGAAGGGGGPNYLRSDTDAGRDTRIFRRSDRRRPASRGRAGRGGGHERGGVPRRAADRRHAESGPGVWR